MWALFSSWRRSAFCVNSPLRGDNNAVLCQEPHLAAIEFSCRTPPWNSCAYPLRDGQHACPACFWSCNCAMLLWPKLGRPAAVNPGPWFSMYVTKWAKVIRYIQHRCIHYHYRWFSVSHSQRVLRTPIALRNPNRTRRSMLPISTKCHLYTFRSLPQGEAVIISSGDISICVMDGCVTAWALVFGNTTIFFYVKRKIIHQWIQKRTEVKFWGYLYLCCSNV